MRVKTYSINLHTQGNTDILDITSEVSNIVINTGLHDGLVNIFCPSSTSGLTTIEYEKGCINDLRNIFNEIIPQNRQYSHNARWQDGNGHSHIRASLLGASLNIPFTNGLLRLGTWQQIVYVDFDTRPRHRELILQILGD